MKNIAKIGIVFSVLAFIGITGCHVKPLYHHKKKQKTSFLSKIKVESPQNRDQQIFYNHITFILANKFINISKYSKITYTVKVSQQNDHFLTQFNKKIFVISTITLYYKNNTIVATGYGNGSSYYRQHKSDYKNFISKKLARKNAIELAAQAAVRHLFTLIQKNKI